MNRPLYKKIADDLRALIRDEELPPGALLPTQLELAEQYGVARMTARQAIGLLVNEGLVDSSRGKGLTVRARRQMIYRPQAERAPRISRQLDRFMSTMSREGRKPVQTIDVAVAPAPPLIATRLGIEPGEKTIVRKRVRWLDGEPFNINDTFYPYDLAKDTALVDPADIARGSNHVLADHGYPEQRAIDEIYIRMPNPEEIHRLQLASGTPVAVHLVTGYTAEDRPVRCDVFVLPGDRHVIVYERVHEPDRGGSEDVAAVDGTSQ